MGMWGLKPMDLKGWTTIGSDTILEDCDHHFRVIAGPGAGKTHWLVCHIKNVLKSSKRLNHTSKIVCISYTNVAAEEIRHKLNEAGDSVEVSTIHSFLYRHVVRPYVWLLKDQNGEPIVDCQTLNGHTVHRPSRGKIEAWIKEHPFLSYLRANLSLTIKCLADLTWKLEGDKCIISQRNSWKGIYKFTSGKSKNQYSFPSDPEVLYAYKRLYWNEGEIHHEDVLYFAFEILKNHPELLKFLVARFPYIFLDEFQDTNPIQTEIVKRLANEGAIVGVIGDPSQSIYKFQDASRQDFLNFHLPDQVNYQIDGNRRSTQRIINFLNQIRADLHQVCIREKIGSNVVFFIGKNVLEAIPLIRRRLVEEHLNLGDKLAILARTNEYTTKIRSESNLINEDVWERLRNADYERERFLYHLVVACEYTYQKRFDEAVRELSRGFRIRNGELRPPLKGTVNSELTKRSIILSVLAHFINERERLLQSTIYDFYNTECLGVLSAFNLNLKKITAGDFRKEAEQIYYKDLIENLRVNYDDSQVKTIHQAKGSEFPAVLVCLESEEDLDRIINANLDTDDDESRIYYVALSRAQDVLYVHVPSLPLERREEKLSRLTEMGVEVVFLEGN